MLRIKMVKSPIGQTAHNRRIIAALGLRKMHRPKLHEDTPTIRGMIHHVKHMLEVEVVEGEVAKKPKRSSTVPVEKAAPVEAAAAAEEKPKAAKPKAAKKDDAAPAEEKPKAKKATAKETKE